MAPNDDVPTPSDLPGGWVETPAGTIRHESYIGSRQQNEDGSVAHSAQHTTNTETTFISNALHTSSQSYYGEKDVGQSSASSDSTAVAPFGLMSSQNTTSVPSGQNGHDANTDGYLQTATSGAPMEQHVVLEDDSSDSEHEGSSTKRIGDDKRPSLQSRNSKPVTEDDLFRALSRRKTNQSNGLSKTNTGATGHSPEEEDEINKLMSKMFGRTRQEASEEEKTRHQGVVFKHLTVKGMGIGAALQPSVGSLFLDPVRLIKNVFTKGPRKAAGKPPVRTILDDFSGCIRPGEMILILGYVFHSIKWHTR
jgi:ATP-binding cassette subfamily G (WHITE) protein 2 (SNQ2)